MAFEISQDFSVFWINNYLIVLERNKSHSYNLFTVFIEANVS